ncbi:MAG: septal ring lytic transglycosylase RlpA family protein [Gammaproteobacteria bacterium]|nr:septal ring lytic transglycosylase RlpA family protein [Gammaproteobacteria bacterium]MDE0361616.1 septal ring lytic transglycosylase RlpA family protein [Rhodospirillaceae bacterium]
MNRGPEGFGFTPRLALIAAVAVSVTLAGCAPHPRTGIYEQAAQQAILEPPRSRLGNPPYYEVFGQRHYVLDSAAGYRRTGVASWYGEQFHGRSTSSGEPYDMFAHTAAHPTLPIPTWVEVTHLDSGKQVIVKVNDRGPFVDNRIIDLSFGAAVVLDMVAQGTAPVEVRALGVSSAGEVLAHDGAPARDPAGTGAMATMPLSLATTSVPPSQRIYLQAGAFSRQDKAARFVDVLHSAGFEQINVDADHGTSPGLYRVRLGPFSDVDAADAAVANLVAMGYERPYLVIGP